MSRETIERLYAEGKVKDDISLQSTKLEPNKMPPMPELLFDYVGLVQYEKDGEIIGGEIVDFN